MQDTLRAALWLHLNDEAHWLEVCVLTPWTNPHAQQPDCELRKGKERAAALTWRSAGPAGLSELVNTRTGGFRCQALCTSLELRRSQALQLDHGG